MNLIIQINIRACRLLYLSLSLLFSTTAFSQKNVFEFNGNGRLKTFPYSFPYSRHGPELSVEVKEYKEAYAKSICDSLIKIATRLDDTIFLDATTKAAKALTSIWSNDPSAFEDFKTELSDWKKYLETPSYPDLSELGITLFPAKPDPAKLNSLLIYPGVEKNPANVAGIFPISINNESPWVIDSLGLELRFRVVWKDYFKDLLISHYTNNKGAIFDQFKKADLKDWLPLLHLMPAQIASLSEELAKLNNLACLDLSPKSLQLYDATIAIARQYNTQLDFVKKMIKTLRDNEDFFLWWLWTSDGDIRFDPFNFTSPLNFNAIASHNDSLNRSSARQYNEKIEDALRLCPACNLNKDSLASWLRQREKGESLFTSADSLNSIQANKEAYTKFQQAGINLYSFSYPYRLQGDSAGYVYQFDAGARYKRVDEVLLRRWFRPGKWIMQLFGGKPNFDPIPIALNRGRGKRILSSQEDDKLAFIAVHNLPKDTKLIIKENATAIKDQSVFDQGLDTITAGLASLTAFASPLGSAVTVISSLFSNPSQIPASRIPPSKATVLGSSRGGNDLLTPEMLNAIDVDKFTLTIDGLAYTFSVEDGKIKDCNKKIKQILNDQVKKDQAHCGENIVKYFVLQIRDKYCQFFTPDQFNAQINELLKIFKDFEIDIIKREMEVRKIGLNFNDALAILQNISNLKNVQLPPLSLTADFTPATDTGMFRTDLHLLGQSPSLTKDNYQLLAFKGKDTIGRLVARGYVNKAPAHFFDLGLGFAATANKVAFNSIGSSANGQLQIIKDTQIVRAIVGLHFYPGKLFNLDNRFIAHRGYGSSSWSRLSVFVGTGFPDPLHNWYSGLSADILPGLRIQTGIHWLWYTKYEILNNQVQNQASAFRYGGWYFGLSISPVAGVKSLLGSFK